MPRAAPAPPHEKGDDRRGRISRALYECISQKGYANTSLKDIADCAGMSPSHVGYYFDNKGAILEHYAEAICRQNLAELPPLGEPDVAKRIDDLADFCLGPGRMNTALLGVIQELTGLAVHDDRLHQIKADHARDWRKYLERFFADVSLPRGMTAQGAAWRAHALLIGLNTNTLFDLELGRARAHDLFRTSLREWTGLPSRPPSRKARPRTSRSPSSTSPARPTRSRSRSRRETS